MNKYTSKAAHFVLGVGLIAPALGYANVPFADVPLFVSGSAKPNLMFVVDDSGSMDFEIVSEFWDSGRAYLFNSGSVAGGNVGGWLTNTGRTGQVSFTPRHYFLRSSDFNAAYYNPESVYSPWPDSESRTYSDASPTAARYEPTSDSSKTLNLTSNTTDSAGNSYYPATYFEPSIQGTVTNTYFDVSFDCASPPEPQLYSEGNYTATLYRDWADYPNDTTLPEGVVGLAPDNTCLTSVKITEADELQNFANWFTYYRRLHHATRASVGESLVGLSGMKIGTFWLHNLRTVEMQDLDDERGEFLDDTYGRFGSGWGGAARRSEQL
jgi:type IV pilus assembly protein PilY1